MNAHKEQAAVLFQAGRRDLLSLQLLLESGRAPHESLGFHAQQACEKFIKAVAVLHGIVFERTHDLIVLHEILSLRQIAVPAEVQTLRALNSYAVQFRYEGCPIELVAGPECLRVARMLEEWAGAIFLDAKAF